MKIRPRLWKTLFSLVALVQILAITSCGKSGKEKPAKPDIILILADDLGYSDLGCYGSEIPTPNLDELAAEGLLFNQMYSCGRCWPSRSTLMTGHYPRALNVDPRDQDAVTPSWPEFIPQYLAGQGYRSYHSGKWNVTGYDIAKAGWEHYYLSRGWNRHFTPIDHYLDGVQLPQPTLEDGYYSTVGITDYLIGFLKEHHEQYPDAPFFGYLAYISPHFPLQALPEDIELFSDTYREGWDSIRARRYRRQIESGLINCELSPAMPEVVPHWNLSEKQLQSMIGPGEAGRAVAWNELSGEQKRFQAVKMSLHAAMVYRIDREVGKLVEELKELGTFDKTVIIFLSDNGASAEQIIRGDMHDRDAPPGSAATFLCLGPGWSTCSNTPFKRHKYWMDEGGISSPFIISWPDGLNASGERRTTLCHFTDILPTILDLAGVETKGDMRPELPGVSLVPAFNENREINHPLLYFDHEGNKALRKGKWKLLSAVPDNRWELYDMETDRSEMHDLAAEYPDLVVSMVKEWENYRAYLDSLRNL